MHVLTSILLRANMYTGNFELPATVHEYDDRDGTNRLRFSTTTLKDVK